MNGAVLIFSLCMQAQCVQQRVPMPDANILTCIAQSQSAIARWMDEHATKTGLTVTNWRCVEAGSVDGLL